MADSMTIPLKSKYMIKNTSPISTESNAILSKDYYHGNRIGMSILAASLLIAAGLSTGLILAICGLDYSWLEMKSVTGSPKERKYIHAITNMKSHGTWMLCSLVICTVACSEYFPFVIQNIYPGPSWIAVLISTFCITVFVELIPQCLIPTRALVWGYYCRWIIWTCMWFTAIVSWPIAFIFNHVSLQTNSRIALKNDELRAFIKYHHKAEKNGGQLGPDATRIMIGALNLDNHSIRHLSLGRPDNWLEDKDLEKAVLVDPKIRITSWDCVKMIGIEDQINDEFINKVKRWSYSRIPVVAGPEMQRDREDFKSQDRWESTRIYGLLHLKSLIGCNTWSKRCPILVKDLPLHPLPIVNEQMSIYALLNIFELGISKMAVIVPHQEQGNISLLGNYSHNVQTLSRDRHAQFSYAQSPCSEKILDSNIENDAPKSAYISRVILPNKNHNKEAPNIMGTKISRVIGLVTLQDITDAIFQKTSHRDIYDDFQVVSQKIEKTEDYVTCGNTNNDITSIPNNGNELRHRKGVQKENELIGNDGTDEPNLGNCLSANSSLQRIQVDHPQSSHSQDTGGSFPEKKFPADNGRVTSKPINSFSSYYWAKKILEHKNSTMPSRRIPWSDGKRSLRCTSASPKIPVLSHVGQVDSSFNQECREYETNSVANQEQQVSEPPVVPLSRVNLSHSESLVAPSESSMLEKKLNSGEIFPSMNHSQSTHKTTD